MSEPLTDEEFEKIKKFTDDPWCKGLVTKVERLKKELKDQKEYVIDEVESRIDQMGVDGSDFDKDLWRELKPLLVKIGLDWNDYPVGIQADDAIEFVRQYFQVIEKENAKLKEENAHLKLQIRGRNALFMKLLMKDEQS